jgi:hypothetical protein
MKVFISYSRHDERAVTSLVGDLQRARVEVWLDEQLGGGESWWTAILEEIRGCSVFLFALSDRSLFSKPCRAELGYAQDLGLPILPVQIGDITSYRADPIFNMQLIDYRQPTAAAGFALMGALNEHAAGRVELPDPLPAAPPIPYEYLQRLGASIHDADTLTPGVQAQTLFELRNALNEESDPTVQADIQNLLALLGRRSDVTYPIAREIQAILGAQLAPAPPPAPDPMRTLTGHAPPGALAPVRSSRRAVVLFGVATALIIAAVVLVLVLRPPGPDGGGGATSSTQAPPTSGATNTVTSENITTPPSTSTSTQPSTELQARLPSDLNCRNSEHYSQGGALANLDCTTGTPLSLLVYSLYPSQSAMETMIRGTSDAVTVIPCPGQAPSPAQWQGGGLNGEVACRILAYPAGPTPQVLWTINSDLVGGWAEGRPNDTIDVVYRWWTSRYQ